MTKPLFIFKNTLRRAVALIDFVDSNPGFDNAEDLLRASVVLTVAAYDHYFTSKFGCSK